ncbi:hypothetical protein [Clostridiisalibacter paucivorans]|uniref:hypothetical protein n=1 Tax=Clostridiisalibacter paucivorans TaxID=408753 RepID=UPI00047C918D|nr:hypothetical protein [Clostridiisalibacter paucivorans]
MDGVKFFNIVSGISSILSLLISIFLANKVIKLSNKIKIDNSVKTGKQVSIGKNNNMAGRDIK